MRIFRITIYRYIMHIFNFIINFFPIEMTTHNNNVIIKQERKEVKEAWSENKASAADDQECFHVLRVLLLHMQPRMTPETLIQA